MTSIDGPGELSDPILRAVLHLTGSAAEPMLAAVGAELGATVGDSRISQVSHDPGRSCTVSYESSLTWSDGSATDELLVAATSTDGPPQGAAVLVADDGAGEPMEVGLWRYPFDPALPSLVHVVVPELAEKVLGALVGGGIVPTVASYRPGRRAVVRIDGGRSTVWVKVLRPSRTAALAETHRRLHDAGVPVPEVLHHDEAAGLLVLSALEGPSLRDRFVDSAQRPDPAAAIALAPVLDALAGVDLGPTPARRRPLRDVTSHVESLVAVAPDWDQRLRSLHQRLDVERRGDPGAIGADVTVHGDLHDAQVVTDGAGGIVGLLDLDDVGVGDRADDLGNLIGHVVSLGCTLAAPEARRRVRRWVDGVDQLAGVFGLDPDEVTRRAAAATLSLATGPYRACDADWRRATDDRIDAAEALLPLARAGRVDATRERTTARERSLRTGPSASHRGAGELETNPTTSTSTSETGGTP